jgi:hypothetical protein
MNIRRPSLEKTFLVEEKGVEEVDGANFFLKSQWSNGFDPNSISTRPISRRSTRILFQIQ